MHSWADQKRFSYFLCFFPSAMMLLLPMPSVVFDFLLFFAVFSTVIFTLASLIIQPNTRYYWLTVAGFFTLTLRMMMLGASVRKIGLAGPNFDGQIIRKITDFFYFQTLESNLTIAVTTYLTLGFLSLATIKRVVNDIHVQIQVRNELNFPQIEKLEESDEKILSKSDFRQGSKIPLFFLSTAKIELYVFPLFMCFALILGVWNRDHFTPDSLGKSIRTSALLIVSTVLCLLPGIALNLFAIREWLSQLATKRVAKLNFREMLFEDRRKAMLIGAFFVVLSFFPGFPNAFLVAFGGAVFAAGFLSDVVEPTDAGHLEIHAEFIQREEKRIELENRVKLQLGRTLWNDYFVGNEVAMGIAVNLSRMKAIQATGTIIEEISIEFNSRLQPESTAILINNHRISSVAFEVEEASIDSDNPISQAISLERITQLICDDLIEVLSDQAALLSHDPALDHLIREFEFKS